MKADKYLVLECLKIIQEIIFVDNAIFKMNSKSSSLVKLT